MNIPVEFKVFAPPFRWDRAGGIRIGRSRVTLDSLLAAYQNATAPIGQIIDDPHFPSVENIHEKWNIVSKSFKNMFGMPNT